MVSGERTRRLRRVLITGIGCISPNGLGREAFWDGLVKGRSGVGRITSFDPSSLTVKIAAEVKGLDADRYITAKDRRHIPRPVLLALAAANEAWSDAGLSPKDMPLDKRRCTGVIFGSGAGPLEFTERQYAQYFGGHPNKISVYSIPSSTPGTLSSELSIAFNLLGPSHVISTGCTSSTDALGYGAQMIALGRADTFLAGGSDAPIMPGIMAGFETMRVLTTAWNDEPERASRPFNRNRSGMVLGEGAWFFILEAEETARERGAKAYAEIAGYGSTCEAYHRVKLDESGEEPARAMRLAIEDAGLDIDAIDYVNLHGTATIPNDVIETRAVKNCFGKRAYQIPLSGTKSIIGHPQGAAGAAGIAATLLALTRGIIHPTINITDPDPECDLDYVPDEAREKAVDIALCNCMGFGSKNSAIILVKY